MKQTLALTVILILVLTFSGCEEVTGGFEEYVGVNLLEYSDGALVHDFASGDWAYQDPAASPVYMNFAPGATADVSGLPAATADISIIEIHNLAQNGNFENAGLPGWSTGGTGTFTHNAAGMLDQDSMYFDTLTAPADPINFDLTALADGFINNSTYNFSFDFLGKNINAFSVNNDAADTDFFIPPWEMTTEGGSFVRYNLSDIAAATVIEDPGVANPVLSIGSRNISRGQEGYIDNLKITRTDVEKWIYTELTLEEAGRLNLISGTYRFSVYIRFEDAAETSPNVDLFNASGVSLCIEDLSPYGSGEIRSIAADAGWSSWTEVSVTGYVDIESTILPGDPVIRLSISPALYYDQEPGRLLIAAPSLTLIP